MAAKKKPQAKIASGFSSQLNEKVLKQLDKKFTDGTVAALLASKIERDHLPAIRMDLGQSLKLVGTAVNSVLQHGFDIEATDPQVSVGAGDTILLIKPSKYTKRTWKPLAYRTIENKKNKKTKRHWKVWAHRKQPKNRIVTALGASLKSLERLGISARLDQLYSPRSAPTKAAGKGRRYRFDYVLRIPNTGTPESDLLAKLILVQFFRGTWHPLQKDDAPSRSFRGGRDSPPEAGSVLYVEAARPLIGPIAVAAGDAFRRRLRRFTK